MSAQDSQNLTVSKEGRTSREPGLRTQLLVMFILVALLPGLLIAGVLLILRLSAGQGSLADVSGVGLSVIIVLISIAVASGAALAMTHEITRRLNRVTRAANEIAVGHLDRRLPVEQGDEIGRMATALNRAMDRLQEGDRRLEPESAASAGLIRRLTQLATAIRAVHESASDREADHLLATVTDQIVAQFGVDHAMIYLLDDAHRFLVLQAASASNGSSALPRGSRLAVNGDSHAAAVATTGTWRLDRHDARRVSEPASSDAEWEAGQPPSRPSVETSFGILPGTRSELNLPVRIGGGLVGVLHIQSTAAAFGVAQTSGAEARLPDGGDATSQGADADAIDALALQIVADQVGLALANAQLLAEAEERVREIARLVQTERDAGWQAMLSARPNWRYVYDGVEVGPAGAGSPGLEAPDLVIPLGPTDRSLGSVAVRLHDGDTLTPENVELARAIVAEASQVLERARLFQSTQQALEEVEVLYRCSQAIVAAKTPDQVLRAITGEIGTFGDAAADGVDCGILLIHDAVGSIPGLRLASVWSEAGRLEGLAGEVWSHDRLPILGRWAADTPRSDVACFASIAEDDDLDARSRETLSIDLGLQGALIVRLGARLGSKSLSDVTDDGGGSSGDLAVPSGAAPVAWLIMGSTAGPYAFSASEQRVYLGIADLAGTVLRNFQLLDLAGERARRAQLVGSISTHVRETLDMDLVLQTALREIGENLGISSIEVRMQPQSLQEAGDAGTHGVGDVLDAEGLGMERDL